MCADGSSSPRENWKPRRMSSAITIKTALANPAAKKAKLAFTILVAWLSRYQYDIDPDQPDSNRFHFVVVDEMFSKVDDNHAEYALKLFRQFGLQLLIVAPLDAKARVTEPYVGECYLHVVKDERSNHSEIFSMTARQFIDSTTATPTQNTGASSVALA